MKYFFSIVVLFFPCVLFGAEIQLFANGRSDCSIVVNDHASVTEKTAAQELQQYIKSMSGVTLPIEVYPGKSKSHRVFIGWNERCGNIRPDDNDEGFTYFTLGSDLYIYGGRNRGTMYGVFSFLERELGVHWFTGSFTQVPRRSSMILDRLNRSERPVIRERLDYYHDAVNHRDWACHNLVNTGLSVSEGKYGQMSATWGVHTFQQLIPPSEYFKKHPDYFSLYQGRRSDNAQLCLSNAAMRKELVKNLRKVISENPGYWCYDVSQNDNRRACECEQCVKLTRHYGGHSGLMIWFVNQVAGEIEKTHPDVLISTFAYLYTRHAPESGIKPAKNVVVKLCDIECCMAHPLNECEQNRDFMNDLDHWKKLTDKIYIWDYTTGFLNYLMPFPNFDVLAKNYRFFSQSNVIGILELGSWDAPWSEFSELKQWLIAKLLWNPYQDTDSLARVFINGYYGAAASNVQQYYDLCRRLVTPASHFTIKLEWNSRFYNDSFISKGNKILEKAVKQCKDAATLQRVRRLQAQTLYLQLRRQSAKALTKGTPQHFRDIIKADNTIVREHGYTVDELLNDLKYY